MGGLSQWLSPGDRALIKPNFVAPFPKATTDLNFVDVLVKHVKEVGAIPVIGESSGFEFDTEATFDILGVKQFAQDKNVELINFDKAGYMEIRLDNGLGRVEISKAVLDVKLIINLPILKQHVITKVSGAVKNLFGLLSKPSRRRLHCYRIEAGIAALAKGFDRILHLVDARCPLSRPVFGESRPLGLCLAGLNPFALDHFGSKLLGINPQKIKHLRGTGAYKVEGDVADILSLPSCQNPLRKCMHRMLYAAGFFLDDIKCRTFGGRSIIPSLHWHFGVHPEIRDLIPEELHRLSLICPVGAIDLRQGKIVREKCIEVRCLRCHYSAPNKVLLKGFNLPKKGVTNEHC
jgi:uncharacterized protein (DUF362 family)